MLKAVGRGASVQRRRTVFAALAALIVTSVAGAGRVEAIGDAVKLTVRVWTDTNGNGLADPGEPPAPGRKVSFTSATYTTSRTSVASGWVGAVVPAGCYSVRLEGTEPITTIPLNPQGFDMFSVMEPRWAPNANRALARSRSVNMCTSDQFKTANIGLRPPGRNTLAVRVWEDLNANGRQDSDERGIPGFKLTISDPVFQEEDKSRDYPTKTTTSSGWVGWSLPNGTCGLVIIPGEFFFQGTGAVYAGPWSPTMTRQFDPQTDNDWMGPFAPFCITNSKASLAIGLLNVDDPRFSGPTVSGTVWTDSNADGQRQSSEPLVRSGITMSHGRSHKYGDCRGPVSPVVDGAYRIETSRGLRCQTLTDGYGTSWETDLPWGDEPPLSIIIYASGSDLNRGLNITNPDLGPDRTDSDFYSGPVCDHPWTCATAPDPASNAVLDLGLKAQPST